MEGEGELQRGNQSHVLVFPFFMAQGHMNPMLQFAKRLVAKGLRVTLVTNPAVHNSHNHLEDDSASIKFELLEFERAKEAKTHEEYVQLFKAMVQEQLPLLIEKHSRESPIKFLIYDSLIPWALDIALGLGIDGAPFFTTSWAVASVFYHVGKGLIKVPPEEEVFDLPSLPQLTIKDLPTFIYNWESPNGSLRGLLDMLIDQLSNVEQLNLIFCNTFDKLEGEVLKGMVDQLPIKTIGPVVPSMFLDRRLKDDKNYGLNLFTPEIDTCIKWLDTKEAGSVVYVSYGSYVPIGEKQMQELAFGLNSSGKNILWVIRDPAEQKLLPAGFLEEASERCLVVSWCTQLEVLAHRAVSCFITHCGWNSVLESICIGVPMVAMPHWQDQTTNAKFIEDVWEVGVRVRLDESGIVTREEIERCVRETTDGEKGSKIKKNVEKLKEWAKEAVDEGGSSDKNIEEFVAKIKSI